MALKEKPKVPVSLPDGDGGPQADDVSALIPLDEFQEDRHDAAWQSFLRRAKEHGARLEAEGRDI